MRQRHQSLRSVYIPEADQAGAIVALSRDKAHHLRKVLRLEWGDELRVLNGRGKSFDALLTKGAAEAVVELKTETASTNPSPLSQIELVLGFPKNKTIDFVVEKATELGIARITPVVTSRSVVMPSAKELDKYVERWQGIAAEALEQSQGLWIPEIRAPRGWTDWLKEGQSGVAFVSEARDEGSLSESVFVMKRLKAAHNSGVLRVVVGPEGGFSEEERAQMRAAGFAEASLGPNILRVETAVISVITLARLALSG